MHCKFESKQGRKNNSSGVFRLKWVFCYPQGLTKLRWDISITQNKYDILLCACVCENDHYSHSQRAHTVCVIWQCGCTHVVAYVCVFFFTLHVLLIGALHKHSLDSIAATAKVDYVKDSMRSLLPAVIQRALLLSDLQKRLHTAQYHLQIISISETQRALRDLTKRYTSAKRHHSQLEH